MIDKIKDVIQKSVEVKSLMASDSELLKKVEKIVSAIIETYGNNGKVLLCGNGGSAADAQHIAAELSGRFYLDRDPLYAEALHVNTSYLTAVANDFSFDEVYSRLLKAKGGPGSVLICLSTSGNSANVVLAASEARKMKMKVFSFTGQASSKLSALSDITLQIPSQDTPRIQEAHLLIGHIICELTEAGIFGSNV